MRRAVEDAVLRTVLLGLGTGLSAASRWSPAIRSQVTRDLVYEVTAGDRVGRQWCFRAATRRISSTPRRELPAHGGLHFADSGLALRRLVSPRAVEAIIDDWHHGRVRVTGRAELLLWFYGLARCLVRLGRAPGPSEPLPGAHVRPDPDSHGDERIVVEPARDELDPDWTGAWRARALLPSVRAMTGEPVEDR